MRYDWYQQDSVSLYGRLGLAYWDVEKQVLSSEKLTANGFSPLGEVGVNYHVTPDLKLSAGYQYIYGIGSSNTGEYDSHGVMIGLSYTFGNSKVKAVESAAPASEETAVVEPSPQVQTFSPKRFDITFSSDATTLSNEATEQLSQASAILTHYSQPQAVVVGHADATGSEAHNQALSEARAQTVANKLIESGVDSEQVAWRGEGETNPIADNRTSQGRAENRRVEVLIPSFQFQE
ncbi:outer membrane protein A precursor [Vibrio ponticus]|nr:outer membrane protein A precursor [Vibrio ponticus]